jgi:hypothetical protein
MVGSRGEFWRRQFALPATSWQRYFDVMFGILAPIVCVVADPIVFRSGGFGRPWIPYATGAYIFMALEILTLTVWLALPKKSPLLNVALAGPLFAGGLASIGLGIRMLPISLIGLIAVIGVLGFTPFLTGFVFLRNGLRAWRSLQGVDGLVLRREIAFLFAFLTMSMAIAGEWAGHRSVVPLIAEPNSPRALQLARWLGTSRADDLYLAWEKETDPVRKDRLAKTFREVTGQDVETRQSVLRD